MPSRSNGTRVAAPCNYGLFGPPHRCASQPCCSALPGPHTPPRPAPHQTLSRPGTTSPSHSRLETRCDCPACWPSCTLPSTTQSMASSHATRATLRRFRIPLPTPRPRRPRQHTPRCWRCSPTTRRRSMPDIYASIADAEPALVQLLADRLELRAADPHQRAMLQAYLTEVAFPDA